MQPDSQGLHLRSPRYGEDPDTGWSRGTLLKRSQHVGPASPNIVGCNMLASFEQTFRLQQRDANTKESKDTVLESDDFPLRRSPLLFDNNL